MAGVDQRDLCRRKAALQWEGQGYTHARKEEEEEEVAAATASFLFLRREGIQHSIHAARPNSDVSYKGGIYIHLTSFAVTSRLHP